MKTLLPKKGFPTLNALEPHHHSLEERDPRLHDKTL